MPKVSATETNDACHVHTGVQLHARTADNHVHELAKAHEYAGDVGEYAGDVGEYACRRSVTTFSRRLVSARLHLLCHPTCSGFSKWLWVFDASLLTRAQFPHAPTAMRGVLQGQARAPETSGCSWGWWGCTPETSGCTPVTWGCRPGWSGCRPDSSGCRPVSWANTPARSANTCGAATQNGLRQSRSTAVHCNIASSGD